LLLEESVILEPSPGFGGPAIRDWLGRNGLRETTNLIEQFAIIKILIFVLDSASGQLSEDQFRRPQMSPDTYRSFQWRSAAYSSAPISENIFLSAPLPPSPSQSVAWARDSGGANRTGHRGRDPHAEPQLHRLELGPGTRRSAIQLIYSNRLEQPRRFDVITHILSRRLVSVASLN
jgi:hypothetical protein